MASRTKDQEAGPVLTRVRPGKPSPCLSDAVLQYL